MILGGPKDRHPIARNPLHRYYGRGDLHFITFSRHRRQPWLGSPQRRDLFLRVFEQVRRRMGFDVLGYVVMPEHVHLLISEPEFGDPSGVVQLIKQRTARQILRRARACADQTNFWPDEDAVHVWQRRFYDFNVFTAKKRAEKIRYMHNNPVTRRLVRSPAEWRWSSYRYYAFHEEGVVKI
jgi:putative transposase